MRQYLPGRLLLVLIVVLLMIGASQASEPNRVFFNINLIGDGEAWGLIRKPGGAVMKFHATRKRGGWTTPWPDSKRFLEEEILPQFVDLEWHTSHNDVVPDNRRFYVRIPLHANLPDEVVSYYDSSSKGRGGSWHNLHINLVLNDDETQLSWRFSKLWRSANPLHYLAHRMNPTGVPPKVEPIDTGGPIMFDVSAKGQAPQLTGEERKSIISKNQQTKAFVDRIHRLNELKSSDGAWIRSALLQGADVEGYSVYEKMLGDAYRPNFTPLMVVAGNGSADLLGLLLEYGANVNATNKNGDTALMYAALAGRTENVNFLLLHGANPSIQNNENDSALSYAEQQSYDQIIKMLLKAGAK